MDDVKRFLWTLGPDGHDGTEWGVSGQLDLKNDYPLQMVLAKDFDRVAAENDALKRELAQLRDSALNSRFVS